MSPNAPQPLDPRLDVLKAHVATYTRSDGTVVQAHNTRAPVAGAKPTSDKGMLLTRLQAIPLGGHVIFQNQMFHGEFTKVVRVHEHGFERFPVDGKGQAVNAFGGPIIADGDHTADALAGTFFKQKGIGMDEPMLETSGADFPRPGMMKAIGDKIDLLKAHVKGYTKKTGTVVNEHDDKRPGAKPKPAAGKMPAKADAASGKADPIGTHAQDLLEYADEYEKENRGVLDQSMLETDLGAFKHIAEAMTAGDLKQIKTSLAKLDTAPRDEAFDFIDPRLWQSLGFDATNPAKALQDYQKKWGAGDKPQTAESGALGKKVTIPDNEEGAASSGVKKAAADGADDDAAGAEPDVHTDDAQKQLLDAGARNVKKHDSGVDYHDKGGEKQTLPAKKKDDGAHYAKHADVQSHVAALGGGDDDPASQGQQGLDAENAGAQLKAQGAAVFGKLSPEDQKAIAAYFKAQGSAAE